MSPQSVLEKCHPLGYPYHRTPPEDVNRSGGHLKHAETAESCRPDDATEIAYRRVVGSGVNYQATSDGKVTYQRTLSSRQPAWLSSERRFEKRHRYAKESGDYEAGIHWRTRGCFDQLRAAFDRSKPSRYPVSRIRGRRGCASALASQREPVWIAPVGGAGITWDDRKPVRAIPH